MAVKFGKRQLSRPTPSRVSMSIDIFSGFAGAILAWVGTASFIPANTSTIIQSILGLLVTLSQIVKPFFGIKTNLQKVDIQDVTEMDDPPKKVNLSKFPDSSHIPKQDSKA